MTPETPLAVTVPRPRATAAPVADPPVTAPAALTLVWDDAGRCTSVRIGDPTLVTGPASLHGDGWLHLVHPHDRTRIADRLRSVLAGGAVREEAVRLARGERWGLLRLEPFHRAGVAGACGVVVDATRSFGAMARMARLVEGFNRLAHPDEIVRAMLDEGIGLLGGSSATVHVLSEVGDELVVAGTTGLPADAFAHGLDRIPLTSPLPAAEVVRTGDMVVVSTQAERRQRYPGLDLMRITFNPVFIVVPLKDAAGRPFGALGVGFDDECRLGAADRDFLADVAAQCALALDRARLADAAERAQDQLGFLDALNAALSSSLQPDAALEQLADLTVPRIADWCIVRLVESPANPRAEVAVAHVDPGQVAHLDRLVHRLPRDLDRAGRLGAALAAGRPLIRGRRGAAMLAPLFDDPGDREAIDAVGVDGVAVFPLHARGRLLGVIGFGNRPGRALEAAEVELATAVAARAGVIVDNVRLLHERSAVARALQHSLLPASLPDIPGIELGARYRAAGRGLDVGGDFYDAFRVDANWWIIAVGDVCGHGVDAAATTGLVRHTIRSVALDGVMPSTVLARLNEMLLRRAAEDDESAVDGEGDGTDRLPASSRFCTVLVGAVQPTDRGVDLILCSGGHPLPLVQRSVGRVDPVGVAGTLLGVTSQVSLTDSVVHLDPGEVLLCYTDGLAERRVGRRSFGEEGVVKALYQARGYSARDLARSVEAEALAFTDDEPADDMAVLALRAVERC